MRPPSSAKDAAPPESDAESTPTTLPMLTSQMEKGRLRGGESSNRGEVAGPGTSTSASSPLAVVATETAEHEEHDDSPPPLLVAELATSELHAAAATPSTDSGDDVGAPVEWIPRHSAFMDLRVRAAKRKTYAELGDEDGFDGASSQAAAEADADSDWSERRSKRVSKKRERYTPVAEEESNITQEVAGTSAAAIVVVAAVAPENRVADAPKAKVAKKSQKISKPSIRRNRQSASNFTCQVRPRSSIPRGIENPDLTCYVNCVLQSLFCSDAVKEFLLKLPDSSELYKALDGAMNDVLIIDELRKIMKALSKKPANALDVGRLACINTASFMAAFRKIMPDFRSIAHYDAHEFFVKSSQRMHEELRFLKNSTVLGDWIRKLNDKLSTAKCSVPISDPSRTMISAFFQGTLETSQVCNVCGTVSTVEDVVFDLGLQIVNEHTKPYTRIEECLATYFTSSSCDRNSYCVRCVQQCNVIKSTFFKIPPLILCLQLRRYDQKGAKLNTPLEYPLEGLDITHYVKIPTRAEELAEEGSSNDSFSSFGATKLPHQYVYSLFSAICHRGDQTTTGHYLSYGKTGGNWFCFNDARVRPSMGTETELQRPYILFYRRDN